MKNILTFESFSDDMEYEKYFYIIEDILKLEMVSAGSIDNPESRAAKMIKKKSKQSGIPQSILKKVYKKGMRAWNSGHRPGVTQQQWATGRVNSFITGKGGSRKSDAELWKKVPKDKLK